jgi:hypothetical protein
MRATRAGGALTATVLIAAAMAACGDDRDEPQDQTAAPQESTSDLPQGAEHVELDPAEFTTEIDNPYWPMAVGSRWVYRETEGDSVQKVVVTVTDRTRMIANGIEARVVRDVVSEDGAPVEVTDDWYAQDSEGNVWYLGEDTAEYEHGEVVTRAGSFEAGVNGAEPGIIMPADPEPGLAYRQEYLKGEAEDRARVVSVTESAEVPYGSFDSVLMTADENPLEPKILEHKFYARDVGPVMALQVSGGASREELISYEAGG